MVNCTCVQNTMVVYKHVSMNRLFPLHKPTYPQSFMLIYGFPFELWVSNLNEEKQEKKKMNEELSYDGQNSSFEG